MQEAFNLPLEVGTENVPQYLNLYSKAAESIASPYFQERRQNLPNQLYSASSQGIGNEIDLGSKRPRILESF
jgi:hypothetical protein